MSENENVGEYKANTIVMYYRRYKTIIIIIATYIVLIAAAKVKRQAYILNERYFLLIIK